MAVTSDDAVRPPASGGAVSDYRLALPPGWVEVPADDRASAVVAEILALRFTTVPQPHRDRLRREARDSMLDAARSAEQRGGLAVYFPIEPVRGTPLAASFVVAYLPPAETGVEVDAADLVLELAADPDNDPQREIGVVEVAGVFAARRRHRTSTRQVAADGTGGTDGTGTGGTGETAAADEFAEQVDYVVPIPGGWAHLLLSFATTQEPLAEPLVALFDAIVETLEWVR